MTLFRSVLGLHALTVAGLALWSFTVRNSLPERLPVHFSSDGTPNGWAETSILTWMAMPLTGLGVLLLIAWGCGRLIGSFRHHPRWINMPRKAEFIKLPAERQEPVWRAMEAVPACITLPVQGLLVMAQLTIYQAAVTGGKGMAPPPLAAFLVVEGLVLVATLVVVFRTLRRALAGG